MVSKSSFSDIIKFETTITSNAPSLGIGFLFCIPDTKRIHNLEEGVLLWVGGSLSPFCKIFRNSVEILSAAMPTVENKNSHHIAIEIKHNLVSLEVDENKLLSYYSHLPLIGGHVGVIRKDMHTEISPIAVYEGSQNVMVNCLAIPDAFFTTKDYSSALQEYRKIAQSFQGRFEGREAIFRAGLTLLEKAKNTHELLPNDRIYEEAISEFNKLHNTPGAPLEYLGKALTYQLKGFFDEEVKCLEFACRKFSKHPLRKHLKEHANLRFHQVSRTNRKITSMFALLILDHLPALHTHQDTHNLLLHLQNQETPSPYFSEANQKPDELNPLLLSIKLASFLEKPVSLFELTQTHATKFTNNYQALESVFFTLLDMDYPKLIEYMLKYFRLEESDYYFQELQTHIHLMLNVNSVGIEKTLATLCPENKFNTQNSSQQKSLFYLMNSSLYLSKANDAYRLFDNIDVSSLYPLKVWNALLVRDFKEAEKLLLSIDKHLFSNIKSPYYLLYGCFLAATKGKSAALTHFSISLQLSRPSFYCLLSYFLNKKISLKSTWYEEAFSYERRALLRQLTLFYTCLNKNRKARAWEEMVRKEQKNVQIPLNFLVDSL